MSDKAVFLDRDGTLVYPEHYPTRPEQLRLYEGIAPYLRMLQLAGFRLVVITNQSGIARGLFTHSDLDRMHEWLSQEIRSLGVQMDAFYFCPHHPSGSVAEFAVECECRKPRSGMLLCAAQDLNLHLTECWFIGDILDDVEAGNRVGCRTVLVDLGTESEPKNSLRSPSYVARDTVHALRIVGAVEGLGARSELSYRPGKWSTDAPIIPISGGEYGQAS